jgi:signal transduction histidine kinase/CheY-like chemotaxis protein
VSERITTTLSGQMRDQRILILAPTGKDAELCARFLADAALLPHICRNIEDLCEQMVLGAGVVFLTEEALTARGFAMLATTLRQQSPWADVPIILLTSGGSESPVNAEVVSLLGTIGNVNLIERPVRMTTLLSTLKAALRARNRQYDVSEHIEREARTKEELEQAFAQIEESSRLKDEFLATVSHELRTPLNAVLGWARLLRSNNLKLAERERALETIERSARSQQQLVEDLLDVSRAISGKLRLETEPVHPKKFIEAAFEALRPIAQTRNIRIKRKIDPRLTIVQGDPVRLRQVMWNLLSNAIKFSSPGSVVELSARRVKSTVEISVKDYGEGIRPDFLPHVFERFRQADMTTTRAHGGLGLGLAIVRQIVELHDGTVSVESDGIGRGAKFIVKLPLPVSSETSSRRRVSGELRSDIALGTRDLEGVRVLVVDDEVDTRDLLRAVLSKRGARVTTAESATAALKKIWRRKPDVLISDVGMPGTDGYELMRRVRLLPAEHGGQIPAVALTAYARDQDRQRALAAGYQLHLTKPVEVAELAASVAYLSSNGNKPTSNGIH